MRRKATGAGDLPVANSPSGMSSVPTHPGAKRKDQRQRARFRTVFALLVLLLLVYYSFVYYHWLQLQAMGDPLKPIKLPRLSDLEQFQGDFANELLWGTYRPGCYLGLRTRLPKSLLAGLMWFDPQLAAMGHLGLRHWAEERDGLGRYGWTRHDGRSFGEQELVDGRFVLNTTFLKRLDGAGPGGEWAVRVTGRPRGPEHAHLRSDAHEWLGPPERVGLLLYVGDEERANGATWTLGARGAVLKGFTKGIGGWRLYLRGKIPDPDAGAGSAEADAEGKGGGKDGTKPLPKPVVMTKAEWHPRNLTDLVRRELRMAPDGTVRLRPGREQGASFAAFQLHLPLPFEVDLIFVPDGPGAPAEDDAAARRRAAALSGDGLAQRARQAAEAFDRRFERAFPKAAEQAEDVGRAALSNLLGGLGYFYGSPLVQVVQEPPPGRSSPPPPPPPPVRSFPSALFTAVPSRSFFPRGFLWDEGFHQLLVCQWDSRLCSAALASWLDLVNEQGWIPREQILGDEAEARVPDPFVVQRTTTANPPTLLLPLAALARRAFGAGGGGDGAGDEHAAAFLRAALPRIRAWVAWYERTQRGPVPGSYRWRGREGAPPTELNPKTLTSGLDDYPRASHPSAEERHVDLRCWMALAARCVADVAAAAGNETLAAEARGHAESLEDYATLKRLHWDAERRFFADFGNHTERVRLAQVLVPPPHPSAPEALEWRRVADAAPAPGFVPHLGYISLFPLLLRLVPADSPELEATLRHLRSEAGLWTPHGLRSLATTSSLYMQRNTEHDAPYWRGPVWINLNYLALAALDHYRKQPGPYASLAGEAYEELRRNVLATVVGNYRRRGFLFEQYSDGDGEGKGSHPFTGWTALAVLVMGETYP